MGAGGVVKGSETPVDVEVDGVVLTDVFLAEEGAGCMIENGAKERI
jgi:hypothetical protein